MPASWGEMGVEEERIRYFLGGDSLNKKKLSKIKRSRQKDPPKKRL